MPGVSAGLLLFSQGKICWGIYSIDWYWEYLFFFGGVDPFSKSKEATAGLSGITKTVNTIRHSSVPSQCHLKFLNANCHLHLVILVYFLYA
jgi:hypothetical protein